MEKILNKLEVAHSRYESVISSIESKLSHKICFDFSIFWQAGDGFVLADGEMGNAPIEDCLEIIKEKGILTKEDYLTITI